MAGTYTTTTLGDALQDLSQRLMDPGHVRWPAEEKTIYIQEAIRTWSALTNHFRATASFSSTVHEAFYELPTILPSLRAQTYTVRNAVDQILWMLLEPPLIGTLWGGTLQYTLSDVLNALQQARDTFLMETGIVQTHSLLPVTAPADGLVALDEDIVNLRRLAWKTANGIYTFLRRSDQWGLNNYRVNWQTATARPPRAYSVSTQPPLYVQLAPVTTVDGTLDMLTINRGTEPNLLIANQSLGVPNDWAWVVVFGALAQLFQRDGLALDMGRASYCEQRWDHGLQMAKAAAVVLAGSIDGQVVRLAAVADADFFASQWQTVAANPKLILTAGHTIVGLAPIPGVPIGGGSYTVTLQVVRNAPIPVALGDYLQVGPEVLNDLMDYAQHLALIKEGIGATQGSEGLLNQFMGMCGTTLAIQWASQPNEVAAVGQTPQDARSVAYQVK